jgi:serine/threonine protein kinase
MGFRGRGPFERSPPLTCKTVDQRADIWAFGGVLHELLAGRRPFPGGNLTETIAAVIHETPDLSQDFLVSLAGCRDQSLTA